MDSIGGIKQGSPDDKGFAKVKMLLEATGGLSLSQVCAVTGLEGTTIQNWVKRGYVDNPIGKMYGEVQIARILIINSLKECIIPARIVLLMNYVNGKPGINRQPIIKESELYNYLCEVLKLSGKSDDYSKSGVESIINSVIRDYSSPSPEARVKVRKALTLMIFACMCADVKRKVEAMMGQILNELENPVPIAAAPAKLPKLELISEPEPAYEAPLEAEEVAVEGRKKVSQALREWDISSVERIIIDHDEEARNNISADDDDKKPANKPWYVRKSTK